MKKMNLKKIIILTGHSGSGKTNLAVNLAEQFSHDGEKVTAVDLDLVNPYFRTADFSQLFQESHVELVTPLYANTNLDIPAICFDLERIASGQERLIVDVGGDEDGAAALGRYALAFQEFQQQIDFLYVANRFRYPSGEDPAEEALQMLEEIQNSSRMRATALVNNSNLGGRTTAEDILCCQTFGEELSRRSGLPLRASTAPDFLMGRPELKDCYPVKRYVKPLWE